MKELDFQPIIDGSSDGLFGEGSGVTPDGIKVYGREVLLLAADAPEVFADGSVVSERLNTPLVIAVPFGREHLLGSTVPSDKAETPTQIYFQDLRRPEHTYVGRHDNTK